MNDSRMEIDFDTSHAIQCVLENFNLERKLVRLLPRLFEKFYEKFEIDTTIMTDYMSDDIYFRNENNYDPLFIYINILGEFEPFRIIHGLIGPKSAGLMEQGSPVIDSEICSENVYAVEISDKISSTESPIRLDDVTPVFHKDAQSILIAQFIDSLILLNELITLSIVCFLSDCINMILYVYRVSIIKNHYDASHSIKCKMRSFVDCTRAGISVH